MSQYVATHISRTSKPRPWHKMTSRSEPGLEDYISGF